MFFTVSFRLFFHVCFTAAKNVSLKISNYLIRLSNAGRLKKKSLVILCLSCLATLLKFIILGFPSFQLVILDFLGNHTLTY